MSKRDIRRHRRLPYRGPVRISWEDGQGLPLYVQGRCLDLSENGLRIEVPHPIPVHSRVSLRADRINLGGSATVKHIARSGSKYIMGVELSQALGDQTVAVIGEPQALRKSVSNS